MATNDSMIARGMKLWRSHIPPRRSGPMPVRRRQGPLNRPSAPSVPAGPSQPRGPHTGKTRQQPAFMRPLRNHNDRPCPWPAGPGAGPDNVVVSAWCARDPPWSRYMYIYIYISRQQAPTLHGRKPVPALLGLPSSALGARSFFRIDFVRANLSISLHSSSIHDNVSDIVRAGSICRFASDITTAPKVRR
jgi:hypothetical protein